MKSYFRKSSILGSIPNTLLVLNFALTIAICAQTIEVDRSFGNNGIVKFNEEQGMEGYSCALAHILHNDGRILTSGIVRHDWLKEDFYLAQYLPKGDIDQSFGDKGYARIGNTNKNYVVKSGLAMETDGDGKILIAGSQDRVDNKGKDVVVLRFMNSGKLDTKFGENGKLKFNVGGDNSIVSTSSMAIDSHGRILIAGNITKRSERTAIRNLFLLRLLQDGTVDETFGSNGIVYDPFTRSCVCQSISIENDGSIILSGNILEESSFFSSGKFFISKFGEDGIIDKSFGQNGILETNYSAGTLHIYDDKSIWVFGVIGGDHNLITTSKYSMSGTLIHSKSNDSSASIKSSPQTKLYWATSSESGAFYIGGHNNKGEFIASFNADGVPRNIGNKEPMMTTPLSYKHFAESQGTIHNGNLLFVTGMIETGGIRQAAVLRYKVD